MRTELEKSFLEAFIIAYPLPARVEKAIRLARYDLFFGPFEAGHIDSEEIYEGFPASIKVIRDWLENIPSELYFDAGCGHLSELEPQGYIDEETGEVIEPYTDETYRFNAEDIRKALLSELADYI